MTVFASRRLLAALPPFALVAGAHAQVFIQNGSFEAGTATTIDNWTVTPTAAPGNVADYAGAGTSVYGSRFLALNPGATAAIGSATSDFGTAATGVSYVVTFVYGQFGGNVGDQILNVRISDASTPIRGDVITNIVPSTSFGTIWRQGSFTFTGTGLPTSVTFSDAGSLGFLGSDLFVDNVQVAPVPEPATLAALGLGAAALLRRRRRA